MAGKKKSAQSAMNGNGSGTGETFSNGRPMSAFHIARRDGGHGGLYAHRIKRLAEKGEQLLYEIGEWKNTEGHQDLIAGVVAKLTQASTCLEEAQGELTRLPRDWSPKAGPGKGSRRGIPTDSLIMFKTTSSASTLREALGIKEAETGRLKTELPNRMALVQFGDLPAFPAFQRLFVEVASNGAGQLAPAANIHGTTPNPPAKHVNIRVKKGEDLTTLNRDALRTRAKALNVPGYSKMSAEALRAAIEAQRGVRQ